YRLPYRASGREPSPRATGLPEGPLLVQNSLDATLPAPAPVSTATAGRPEAALHAVFDDGRHQFGIWTCTPGEFRSDHRGYVEHSQILAGAAELVGDDGVTHTLRPGESVFFPDGWTGLWRITETIRKTFAIVRDAQ
ncbi:MAG: protein of unknown function cupin 3, partial [Mycobacterium sp.]|nr:protein of unknown function cupin 3 [Mycobacterium sp.]